MAWIADESRFLLLLYALHAGLLITVEGLYCGYPGSPAFGRPIPVRESYRPAEVVRFSCESDYVLQGNLQRKCSDNGTWTGNLPICDRSHSKTEQVASAPSTVQPYDPRNAIDGDRNTCTYTQQDNIRWVRVDMQKDYVVQAVTITVPRNMYTREPAHFTVYVISAKGPNTATYHKCADFTGKFSTPTMRLQCSGGGIYGSYVHIQDNRNAIVYFSVCEIEIFVQKDSYECGEPDRPTNSYTSNPESGVIEYRCVYGYRLEGDVNRRCLPNGQWSGSQPLCTQITCPLLSEVPHGVIQYTGPARSRPVLGTKANISCSYGYQSSGTALQCMESGQWSEGQLSCKPIDCRIPALHNDDQQFVLLNGSTTYGSMALLYCGDFQNSQEDDLSTISKCREDGMWTPTSIDCATPNMLQTLGFIEEEDNTVSSGAIIGMAVVVFILLVILILILLFRRKQLSRKHSTDSLPSKETTSSLSPCETKVPYENDTFYASIGMNEKTPERDNPATKCPTSVERGILSTILFAKRKSANIGKTKAGNDTNVGTGPCLYEEVGSHSNAQKKAQKEICSMNVDSQPLYAQVDFEGKRRCRMNKALKEQQAKGPSETNEVQYSTCHFYDSELDSEPIKLRELPPIPDDDQSSGTYTSLSRAPEPPPSPTYMRENLIYGNGEANEELCNEHQTVMKENSLYSVR